MTRVEDEPAVAASPVRSTTVPGRCLVPHVVAYVVLLLLVAWRTDLDAPWMSDDGAYGAQVTFLRQGSWAQASPLTWGTDPSEVATFGKSTVTADGEIPYVKHPAWIVALVAADRVGVPVVGAYVLAVASALLAAFIAGRLAEGSRWAGVLAFWTVALGPPLVWSSNLWAHGPAAALGAVAAWAAVRWWSGRSWRWAAVMVAAPSVLGLFRSEGLLLGVALGAVVAVRVWTDRRDRSEMRSGMVVGAVLGVALVASRIIDRGWVDRVAPGAEVAVPAAHGPWLRGRVTGAEATFLSGGLVQPGRMLALAAVVLLALGAVLVLRPSLRRIGWVVLAAGIGSFVLRALSEPDDLLLGLLPAVPLLACGLASAPVRRGPEHLRVLALLAGVYLGSVVLTQYPDGGAMDWGGRFTAPALVALVVLAVAGIERIVALVPEEGRRPVVGAVVALVALPVVPAIVATNGFRDGHGEIVAAVEHTGAPVAIATERAAPLVAWSTIEDVSWTVTGEDGLLPLLDRARAAGETDLAVVGRWIDDDELAAAGWTVDRVTPVVAHLQLSDADARGGGAAPEGAS